MQLPINETYRPTVLPTEFATISMIRARFRRRGAARFGTCRFGLGVYLQPARSIACGGPENAARAG